MQFGGSPQIMTQKNLCSTHTDANRTKTYHTLEKHFTLESFYL